MFLRAAGYGFIHQHFSSLFFHVYDLVFHFKELIVEVHMTGLEPVVIAGRFSSLFYSNLIKKSLKFEASDRRTHLFPIGCIHVTV